MVMRSWQGIVMGCSSGGLAVLQTILACFPTTLPVPVVVVAHRGENGGHLLVEILGGCCALPVVEAEDKTALEPGMIYLAPAGYHLLIEKERIFSLSVDPKVYNVRPSIDVLFQSAAEALSGHLIGVLLTGANEDGCEGMKMVRRLGGLTIVQDPATAQVSTMPESAIKAGVADRILAPAAIGSLLASLFA